MKNIIIFGFIMLACSLSQKTYSQNIGELKGISYQAVAIDEDGKEIVGMDVEGKPLFEKTIGVRFTITKGFNGSILWEETHTVITDKYGLFSLIIGLGTPTTNCAYSRLLDIPWIDANQFLKVEIAIKNDGNYRLVSNQQFMTVPFSFYTDDIADDAITTSKILNETILSEDIATGAVTSSEILDRTILSKDVDTGAITTNEILNRTLLTEDIDTSAVTTTEILDRTVQSVDIDTNAVTTTEILNATILNEDIADGTIDLTTKITSLLPVSNGGTGNSTLTGNSLLLGDGTASIQSLGLATNGQIPIGVTGGKPVLANLTAGTGVTIANTAGGIQISSSVTQVNSDPAGTFVIGNLPAGSTYVSNAINAFVVSFGDVIIGSIDVSLQGCMLTAYVSQPNVIRIAIFNGTGGAINLGTVNLRVLIVH